MKKTSLYPMVEFKKDTYELDEFDAASIFVLVGEEKALVIDAGMGIGDLLTAVRRITDKPLVLAITHGHVDHIMHSCQFDECYLNEADWPMFFDDVERRKYDTGLIAQRQKGIYAYDMERDITPWEKTAKLLPLDEGWSIDLGGRVIRAYAAPGHSKGSMIFLDEKTRTLFAGDALNNNLLLAMTMDPSKETYVPLEDALKGLLTMEALGDKYDDIFNGHHDFRPLGVPLKKEILPNAIAMLRQIMDGSAAYETQQNKLFPHLTDTIVRMGEGWVTVDPRFLPQK